MPNWLKQQLKRAYLQKDLYRIRILNQCWFYYKHNNQKINTYNEN